MRVWQVKPGPFLKLVSTFFVLTFNFANEVKKVKMST